MYTVQCTMYSVHWTVYTVHSTLYSVHFTGAALLAPGVELGPSGAGSEEGPCPLVFTVQCTVYSVYCMYSV